MSTICYCYNILSKSLQKNIDLYLYILKLSKIIFAYKQILYNNSNNRYFYKFAINWETLCNLQLTCNRQYFNNLN